MHIKYSHILSKFDGEERERKDDRQQQKVDIAGIKTPLIYYTTEKCVIRPVAVAAAAGRFVISCDV